MKVAIVHDYIKEYGGAERVLEELISLFSDATIYTSLYLPDFLGPHKERFKKYKIKTTFLNFIPFRQKLLSPLRLLSPLAFLSLDLSDYDVILVSQAGAYFPNLVRKGKAKLICYTHTPPRYLYGYKTARNLPQSIVIKSLVAIIFHILRMVDFKASENVDEYLSNSEEVKARIQKFYRRDAKVVYPPVFDASKTPQPSLKSKTYYVAGGRLARAKGMDIIVNAFNKNGLPLTIFGKGFAGFDEELKNMAKKNISFVGEVGDAQKLELMRDAKAFIFSAFEEDFGITPVESMSVGTPVIAFRSGGVKETVVEGVTGVFYEENTVLSLNEGVKKFEKMKLNSHDCVKQAQKFSKERFDKKIKEIVSKA